MTKNTEPEKDTGNETAQSILDFGSAMTATPHGNIYCLTIIGQIEGHMTAASGTKTTKYEHVLPLLAKLEESGDVDGVLFHEAKHWFSAGAGSAAPYPAPFNHAMYIILNLAVGGNWVGYPDETTDFENAVFAVDYVRVYQRT